MTPETIRLTGYVEELLDTVEHHPLFYLMPRDHVGRTKAALRDALDRADLCDLRRMLSNLWDAGVEQGQIEAHVRRLKEKRTDVLEKMAATAVSVGISPEVAADPMAAYAEAREKFLDGLTVLVRERCGCK